MKATIIQLMLAAALAASGISIIDVSAAGIAPPHITPHDTQFKGSLEITVTSSTPRASIFYTLDGSEPTRASTLYTRPISISSGSTIKAKAYLPYGRHKHSTTTTRRFVNLDEHGPRIQRIFLQKPPAGGSASKQRTLIIEFNEPVMLNPQDAVPTGKIFTYSKQDKDLTDAFAAYTRVSAGPPEEMAAIHLHISPQFPLETGDRIALQAGSDYLTDIYGRSASDTGGHSVILDEKQQLTIAIAPNPFSPHTTEQKEIVISATSLQQILSAKAVIYDYRGVQIAGPLSLLSTQKGSFEGVWNGVSHNGSLVSSGTYLAEVTAVSFEKRHVTARIKFGVKTY
ncbi:MAG: hypothetical protein GF398_13915 [Chitinivibrionales bacterium]|nr:hypothetical protein [Chitinivibrionales bacterium]